MRGYSIISCFRMREHHRISILISVTHITRWPIYFSKEISKAKMFYKRLKTELNKIYKVSKIKSSKKKVNLSNKLLITILLKEQSNKIIVTIKKWTSTFGKYKWGREKSESISKKLTRCLPQLELQRITLRVIRLDFTTPSTAVAQADPKMVKCWSLKSWTLITTTSRGTTSSRMNSLFTLSLWRTPSAQRANWSTSNRASWWRDKPF